MSGYKVAVVLYPMLALHHGEGQIAYLRCNVAQGGIESEMQHIELIDVLLSGELTKAEKLLQRHIRRTKLLVRAAMAEGREEKP